MSLVFAVTVLAINFVLWVLLLTRFRGLFDTGDIVDKTRAEITELTRDLNRVAQRDIALFNECSKQLHALLEEADKKVILLKDETQKVNLAGESLLSARSEMEAFQSSLQLHKAGAPVPSSIGGAKKRAVSNYKKAAPKKAAEREKERADNAVGKNEVQNPLFDEKEDSININVPALQVESGYAAKNIGPHIYLSDKPQENTALVTEKVMEMARKGFQSEQIAEQLSCSLIEVQMILDMSLVSGGQ